MAIIEFLNSKYFKYYIGVHFLLISSLLFAAILLPEWRNRYILAVILVLIIVIVGILILKHYNTKAYKNKLLSYQKALESSGIFGTLDNDLTVTHLNEKFKEISNINRKNKKIKLFELFPDTVQNKALQKEIERSIKENNRWNGIIEIEDKKEGRIYTLSTSIYPFYLSRKQNEGYIIFAIDISEHIELEKKFKEQLYKDHLTGLPNRLKLIEDLKSRDKKASSMILIDIDEFGVFNDYFGINHADSLLKKVAEWLKEKLPTKDSKLYKVDSSVFGIFINSYISYNDLRDYLKLLHSTIKKEKFVFNNENISVSFTLGAALNTDMIFKNAYQILKKAKDQKKPYDIFTFNPSLSVEAKRRIFITKYIKEAIENDMIFPCFQPIQNVHTGEIEKFESLIRIRTKDGQVKYPNEFVPVAVKTKLYPTLTREMIKKCFENFHHRFREFSVNISTRDILNKKTVHYILEQMDHYNVASWVVFEILESDKIEDEEKVYQFVNNVKSLGARIAIDDFGTGYSNFDHLLKLRVDYIKLDGSLIKNIDIKDDSEAIVQTIVSFAKSLGIKTIAEFVSNKTIYDKIKSMGIDYAQGYYIGKPAESIEEYLEKERKRNERDREKNFLGYS